MIYRIPCHCGNMRNYDDSKEDASGWLYYEVITDNGKRKFGLCTRCQAAIECYLNSRPKSEPKKRGRPPKKKEE